MATILLLSTADTELLAARNAGAGYRTANPVRIEGSDLAALTAGADLAVVRLLGGRKAWPEGLHALRRAELPLVALGGEAAPDAELMALSTVPAGIAAQALGYLREGGPENLRELAAFLSDTVLLTGEGFAPPRPMPQYGLHEYSPRWTSAGREHGAGQEHGAGREHDRGQTEEAHPAAGQGAQRPIVAVVYYRAHELSGNTAFVDTLCAALEQSGATAMPVFCGSLRNPPDSLIELLRQADAVITTVLAAGGATASHSRRRGSRRRRRIVGGGGARRARRTDHPGSLRDIHPRGVGGVGRGAHPDGCRHAGGDTGVRRPPDHGAVLL